MRDQVFFPGGRQKRGINFNAQGIPYGQDVVWFPCEKCGGEGVHYPDADSAEECPDCQGLGKIPYERPTHGAWKQPKRAPWRCAAGHENPEYVSGLCREKGCHERKAA